MLLHTLLLLNYSINLNPIRFECQPKKLSSHPISVKNASPFLPLLDSFLNGLSVVLNDKVINLLQSLNV